MKATVSAMFAAAILSVLGAPTSLHTAKLDNCTSVQAPAGSNLLTGGKVHIHIVHEVNATRMHNKDDKKVKLNETSSKDHHQRHYLFWNATFMSNTQSFTSVLLAQKLEKEPMSVTEWSVQSAGSGFWQFSTNVGPAGSPWCMSKGGAAAPCSSADQFSIKCKRCKDGKDYHGCSIRDESDGSKCMRWDVKLGAMVTTGDVHPDDDCPHRVDIHHVK